MCGIISVGPSVETSHIPKVYFHPAGLGWAGWQVCGQQGAGRRDQFPAKDTAKLGAKGGQPAPHRALGPVTPTLATVQT